MRSSFCNFGDCVEVVVGDTGVTVGDTKTGETLAFTHQEWGAFLLGVKAGEFDVDASGG